MSNDNTYDLTEDIIPYLKQHGIMIQNVSSGQLDMHNLSRYENPVIQYINDNIDRYVFPAIFTFSLKGDMVYKFTITYNHNKKMHQKLIPSYVVECDDVTVLESWYYNNYKHNDNSPAHVQYYPNGYTVKEETWYNYGNRYNEDEPIKIEYNVNGHVYKKFFRVGNLLHEMTFSDGYLFEERWFDSNGNLHRDHHPALIQYFPYSDTKAKEIWYYYNDKHRTTGPAVLVYTIKDTFMQEIYSYIRKSKFFKYKWLRNISQNIEVDVKDTWYINGRQQ